MPNLLDISNNVLASVMMVSILRTTVNCKKKYNVLTAKVYVRYKNFGTIQFTVLREILNITTDI